MEIKCNQEKCGSVAKLPLLFLGIVNPELTEEFKVLDSHDMDDPFQT